MTQKKTIGLLTIGQAPRHDMMQDLKPLFKNKVNYIEAGALDGLTLKEVSAMKPKDGEHYLVTRMSDGTVVTIAAHHITERMQNQISALEKGGVCAIMILCTEAFERFDCKIPIIYPNNVLKALVPMAAASGHIGVILPEAGQIEDFTAVWKHVVPKVTATYGSPYISDGSLERAAEFFTDSDVDLIILDCMGYSAEKQQLVAEISGKPALLSKVLAARVLLELI